MGDLYPSLDAILSWTADRAHVAWSLDAIDKAVAAHDAAVKAGALRDAAAMFRQRHNDGEPDPWYWSDSADVLDARADRIEAES